MTVHTPGPWKRSGGAGISACMVSETLKSGRKVARRTAVAKGETVDEVDANARLIAAAPDLLVALKDLYEDCVEYARINNLHNSDGTPASNHAMRTAAAVITKATGATA